MKVPNQLASVFLEIRYDTMPKLTKGQGVQPLSIGGGGGSNVTCWHIDTSTSCPLGGAVGMWCKDNSRCSDGSLRDSGWYPCGICIGGDL
jgi:hypothetical protein